MLKIGLPQRKRSVHPLHREEFRFPASLWLFEIQRVNFLRARVPRQKERFVVG
jgi:hypothetical protein